MCPTCRASRARCATWARSARSRARSTISSWRCASSPVPTATRRKRPPVPIGPTPKLKAGDLRIAVLETNPLVKVSAGYGQGRAGDGEAAVQGRRQGEARRARGARLDAELGGLVRSLPVHDPVAAAAVGARALLPDDRFVRSVGALGGARRRGSTWASSSPCSTGATARCASARAFLDEYDAWLMPVMPDAAFIRQSQKQPLVIDGVPLSVFLRRHVLQLSRQPDRPAVDRAAVRLLEGRPADRPAAHRQALGRGEAARRRQGAGEAAAALSGAAGLRVSA